MDVGYQAFFSFFQSNERPFKSKAKTQNGHAAPSTRRTPGSCGKILNKRWRGKREKQKKVNYWAFQNRKITPQTTSRQAIKVSPSVLIRDSNPRPVQCEDEGMRGGRGEARASWRVWRRVSGRWRGAGQVSFHLLTRSIKTTGTLEPGVRCFMVSYLVGPEIYTHLQTHLSTSFSSSTTSSNLLLLSFLTFFVLFFHSTLVTKSLPSLSSRPSVFPPFPRVPLTIPRLSPCPPLSFSSLYFPSPPQGANGAEKKGKNL